MANIPNDNQGNPEQTADQSTGAKDKEPAAPYDGTKPHKTKHTWLEKSAVAIAVLAFLAAAGQGYVSNDTEKRTLRAYMNVASSVIYIDSNNNIGSSTVAKNYGQTPAYAFSEWVCVAVRPISFSNGMFTEPSSLPIPKNIPTHRPESIVAPQESAPHNGAGLCDYDLSNFFDKKPLTPEERAEIKTGAKAVYLYGIMTYKDIFDIPHHTEFRVFSNDALGLAGGITINAENGNKAD